MCVHTPARQPLRADGGNSHGGWIFLTRRLLAGHLKGDSPLPDGNRPSAGIVVGIVLTGNHKVPHDLGLVNPHRNRKGCVTVKLQGRKLGPRFLPEPQRRLVFVRPFIDHGSLMKCNFLPASPYVDRGFIVKGKRQQLRGLFERGLQGTMLLACKPFRERFVDRRGGGFLIFASVFRRFPAELMPAAAVPVAGYNQDGWRIRYVCRPSRTASCSYKTPSRSRTPAVQSGRTCGRGKWRIRP